MESNAGVRSQGSVSSISTSNLTVDSQVCGSGSIESAESVNHGLVLWNQTRQQWVGSKRSESRERFIREPILNENVTYESLLGSNKRKWCSFYLKFGKKKVYTAERSALKIHIYLGEKDLFLFSSTYTIKINTVEFVKSLLVYLLMD